MEELICYAYPIDDQADSFPTEEQRATASISQGAPWQIDGSQHTESSTNTTNQTDQDKKLKPAQIRQTCNVCAKTFPSRCKLQEHTEVEHEGKRHTCHKCGIQTKWKRNLKVHLLKVHNIETMNTCSTCGKTYDSKHHLKEHIQTLHEGKRFTCHVCGRQTKWKSNLTIHLYKIHNIGQEPLKKEIRRYCQECRLTFTSNALLTKHLVSVHNIAKPFKCSCCSKTFKLAAELTYHKMEHLEFVRYNCPVCNMRFRLLSAFEAHCKKFGHEQVTDGRGADASNMTCYQCKRSFTRYQTFDLHIKDANTMGCSNIGNLNPQCNKCNARFSSHAELKKHYKSKHAEKGSSKKPGRKRKKQENPKPSKQKCKVCGKMVSSNASVMYYHLKWHEGKKDYKCDICGFETAFPTSLRQHNRLHHVGEHKFKCDVCNTGFKQAYDLRRHEYKHKDIPPPKCSGCGKEYYTDFNYGKHLNECKEWKMLPKSSVKDKEEEVVCKYKADNKIKGKEKRKRKGRRMAKFNEITGDSIACDKPIGSESDDASLRDWEMNFLSLDDDTSSTPVEKEVTGKSEKSRNQASTNLANTSYKKRDLELSFKSIEDDRAVKVRICMELENALKDSKPVTCANKNGLVIDKKVANRIRALMSNSHHVSVNIEQKSNPGEEHSKKNVVKEESKKQPQTNDKIARAKSPISKSKSISNSVAIDDLIDAEEDIEQDLYEDDDDLFEAKEDSEQDHDEADDDVINTEEDLKQDFDEADCDSIDTGEVLKQDEDETSDFFDDIDFQ